MMSTTKTVPDTKIVQKPNLKRAVSTAKDIIERTNAPVATSRVALTDFEPAFIQGFHGPENHEKGY
jgi:hypothetical protein